MKLNKIHAFNKIYLKNFAVPAAPPPLPPRIVEAPDLH